MITQLQPPDHSAFDRYVLVLLAATELLMSFTFLGYLHFPPISITIAYLPILVAGVLYGTKSAVLIGFLFGLASLFKASAHYVMPTDMAFSPFLSGDPLSSLTLALGLRMVFAAVVGLAFTAVKRLRHPTFAIAIVAAAAPSLQAVLVRWGLETLFPSLGVTLSGFTYHANDFLISVVCALTVLSVRHVYATETVQNLRHGINLSSKVARYSHTVVTTLWSIIAFVLSMKVLAAVYFTNRAAFMLNKHGIDVSSEVFADMNLLQMQFLLAAMALSSILAIALILSYKYAAYTEYVGGIDALTGILGRRLFMDHATEQLAAPTRIGTSGWFLMLDVDHFKSVNDTFGHPEGDRVLKATAQALLKTFGDVAFVGRLGGDEFALLLRKDLTQEELEHRIRRFYAAIAPLLPEPHHVTSSVGAVVFQYPQTLQALMNAADKRLYDAKARGGAQWVTAEFSAPVTSTETVAPHP